jgi:hypothetical protein
MEFAEDQVKDNRPKTCSVEDSLHMLEDMESEDNPDGT